MAREIPGMWEYLNGGHSTGKDRDAPRSGAPWMSGDTGCRYSPSCLSCHLPRCYWEMTRTERRRWDTALFYGKTPEMTLASYKWLEGAGELLRLGWTEEDIMREVDRVFDSLRQPPGTGGQ